MPSITFVLPHYLYWSGLLLFPLIAMWALRRATATAAAANQGANARAGVSYPIAYFLLVTTGFIGMHRVYLRNMRGLLFVPVFIALLLANAESRDSRDGISLADNRIVKAEFLLETALEDEAAGKEGAAEKVAEQTAALAQAKADLAAAEATRTKWIRIVQGCALLILAGLLFDAVRIPKLKRRCEQLDAERPLHRGGQATTVTAGSSRVKPERTAFARAVGRLNNFTGTFVAYWSVIAVFVYYYEVIARYVFNSPTNWAHESMFLMFGAQYLLAGGFCLREDAHVRVDVFYARFSARAKAKVNVITSVFFFIFAVSLLTSGWTFFLDSLQVREVSFTEWAIQYYPVKLTLAAGASLILLQGIARLLADFETLGASTSAKRAPAAEG